MARGQRIILTEAMPGRPLSCYATQSRQEAWPRVDATETPVIIGPQAIRTNLQASPASTLSLELDWQFVQRDKLENVCLIPLIARECPGIAIREAEADDV